MIPEPSSEEREALESALAELLEDDRHPSYASAWRRAGIDEKLGLDGGAAE